MSFGRRVAPEESIQSLTKAPPKLAGTNGEAEAARLQVEARFEARQPRFKMVDVILPDQVKIEITTLRSCIKNHALIYGDWEFNKIDCRNSNIAISFYGPPGTGKTMCAEALASELGKTILEINYAEIESKYVGDTPKNIVAAFAAAKRDNAAIFFDEADSILGRRLTNVTQSADHGVNVSRAVMLKQLDQFDGIVIFATNLARNYDAAFVRRILHHVHVPLPDENCRLLLWKRMISAKVPGMDSIDFFKLAQQSEGLTGGTIKNATLIALSSLAEQPEAGRRLVNETILSAIANVRRAQEEIGPSCLGAMLPLPPSA